MVVKITSDDLSKLREIAGKLQLAQFAIEHPLSFDLIRFRIPAKSLADLSLYASAILESAQTLPIFECVARVEKKKGPSKTPTFDGTDDSDYFAAYPEE